jgi:hypothetical protein
MATRPARTHRAKKHLTVVANNAVEASAAVPDSEHSAAFIESERRLGMIAEAAYYRAVQRGFEPGHELEDWYAAENEIDTQLARSERARWCDL